MRKSRRRLAASIAVAFVSLLPSSFPTEARASDATLTLSKTSGPPTTRTVAIGAGFGANEVVDITFDARLITQATTDPQGDFSRLIVVPKTALPGLHDVTATGESSGLSASATFTVRTDWPMFHFSQDRKGFNPFENVLSPSNVSSLEVKWATPATTAIAVGPAIVGGSAYVGTLDGEVLAFDAATGSPLWSEDLGSLGISAPAVAKGVVYVGVFDGRVAALDGSTGDRLWVRDLGGLVVDTPVVIGDVVYVGAGSVNGTLYALEASSGDVLWSVPYGGGQSSLAVAGGVLYIGGTDATVYAFDAKTGISRWTAAVRNLVDATPAVANGLVLVGTSNSEPYRFYAFDADTGSLVWARELDGGTFASPAVARGIVYVGTLAHSLYVMDAATGTVIWRRTLGADVASSPAVAGGVVFVGCHDHKLYAFNAKSGSLLWSFETGGIVQSSPAVSDGVVYVGSHDTNFYAFSLPD